MAEHVGDLLEGIERDLAEQITEGRVALFAMGDTSNAERSRRRRDRRRAGIRCIQVEVDSDLLELALRAGAISSTSSAPQLAFELGMLVEAELRARVDDSDL